MPDPSRPRWRLLPYALLLASVAALAACSSGQGDTPDLSGTWVSPGYYCPALVRHTETVRITQTGEHLDAVKTVGDRCVRAGHQTFTGTVRGNGGRVDIWLGSPGGTPAIGLRNQRLSVQSPDRFTISFNGSPVTFTRSDEASASFGVPWWWLVLVVLVLIAVVVRVRVRSARARPAP